jgi:Glycosyl transferase family 2
LSEVLSGLAAAVWVVPTLLRCGVWRWLGVVAGLAGAWLVAMLDVPAGSVLPAALVGLSLLLVCFELPASRPAVAAAVAVGAAGLAAWLLVDSHPVAVGSGRWVLLALALPAIVGAAGLGGAPWGLRLACALPILASAVAIAVTGGDWTTALAWTPAAAALGLTALLRGRRGAGAGTPQADALDEEMVAGFARDNTGVRLAPVVVVIAAYNEAAGLPGVVGSLPREVLGLGVDVLVVDDGSTDGTAQAVRSTGRGHVVACPFNRGQGRALRLGYRIARQHGASYVVTTDADGQYDPAEIPLVLAPVVEGRADFVTGSRRRGRLENKDAVRQAGTYVFAWLATLLLGRHVTDTSFGLRAMRTEVTAAVTLNEPQYQASELLLGVFSHGFRYAEVPGTMRVRSAGASKKGGNLRYGARYARVMLGTWWREGCPRPVAETAPALGGSTRHVADRLPV